MESLSRQAGKGEFFARTLVFEPLKGLRNPESDTYARSFCSTLSKKTEYLAWEIIHTLLM